MARIAFSVVIPTSHPHRLSNLEGNRRLVISFSPSSSSFYVFVCNVHPQSSATATDWGPFDSLFIVCCFEVQLLLINNASRSVTTITNLSMKRETWLQLWDSCADFFSLVVLFLGSSLVWVNLNFVTESWYTVLYIYIHKTYIYIKKKKERKNKLNKLRDDTL